MSSQPIFRRKALEKLSSPERLDQLLSITTPQGWLILLALGALLVAALLWAILGTIAVQVDGEGMLIPAQGDAPDAETDRIEAVLYFNQQDGQRIQPGMEVKLSPPTVRKEEYGLLLGEVTTIKPTLATQPEMLAALGNDALVQALAANGKLIEVRVKLLAASETPSGYRWTSLQGPPTRLQGWLYCTGTVTVQQQHPIELVFYSK